MAFDPFIQESFQNPRDYDDYNERGIYFLNRGQLDSALSDFNKSIQLLSNPEHNPTAYLNRGIIYRAQQQYEHALSDLKIAVSTGIVPIIHHAYLHLGMLYINLRKWSEAEMASSKGLSLMLNHSITDPLYQLLPVFYYNRGIARKFLGRLDEAFTDFQKGSELDPNDVEYVIQLGEIFLRKGNLEDAISKLNRAEQLDKENADLYLLRFQTHLQMNKLTEALNDAQRFLELGGDKRHSNRAEVEETIASLRVTIARQRGEKMYQPEVKYPESKAKFAAVKELIEEKQYDAARSVLKTMNTSRAKEWLDKLNPLQLAQSLESGILGLLEEWIQGNSLFDRARDLMIKDAMAYLYYPYSREVTQEIIEMLKRQRELSNKNFSRIVLSSIDISHQEIVNANFSMAEMSSINFDTSNLMYSRFIGSNLEHANLQYANCSNADFTRSNLTEANFSGANLQDAILHGANVARIKLDINTILPDGAKWSPGISLTKFTHY